MIVRNKVIPAPFLLLGCVQKYASRVPHRCSRSRMSHDTTSRPCRNNRSAFPYCTWAGTSVPSPQWLRLVLGEDCPRDERVPMSLRRRVPKHCYWLHTKKSITSNVRPIMFYLGTYLMSHQVSNVFFAFVYRLEELSRHHTERNSHEKKWYWNSRIVDTFIDSPSQITNRLINLVASEEN